MNKLKFWQITIVFVLFLQSCRDQDWSSFTKKYDDVSFDELKNSSIYLRGNGHSFNTSIYFINMFEGKCSPYVIEANNDTKKLLNINNDLVIKSCGKDYLTTDQIHKLFNAYIQHDLRLLQVDSEGNVYINPNESEHPRLFRKAPGSA